MLSRLRNMFRVPDLRNKILFTIGIIAVYRLGAHLPVPYVDFAAIKQLQNQANNSGVVGFLDLFSGGAITNVAIFFLGIMPYITASIIMQLLGVVIPKLEQWQNEGQVGQKKITQWTRYVTIGLALVQSTGFVFALHQGKSGLARLRRLQRPGPDPALRRGSGRADRAHVDGRYRHGDVAGRAHHPTRDRQRHVDPDLRLGGVAPPRAGRGDLERGQQVPVLHDHPHRHRDDRRDRVRGIGAAPDPCAIRETCRGPPHVRRAEHLHPAEGQPVRCDPGDLRQLDPVVPRADRVCARRQLHRRASSGSTTTS